jgi:hypothetical protein
MTEPKPTMADAKAKLAAHGVSVNTTAKLDVLSTANADRGTVVVLDRTVPGWQPEYCVHGFTMCVICEHPVYLGSETVKLVKDGTLPVCKECAEAAPPDVKRLGHASDHLRKDGPHD